MNLLRAFWKWWKNKSTPSPEIETRTDNDSASLTPPLLSEDNEEDTPVAKRATKKPNKKATKKPAKKPAKKPTKKPAKKPTKKAAKKPAKKPTKKPTKIALKSKTSSTQTRRPAIRRKKEKIFIQVGVDFGTSSTKIAYTRPGLNNPVRPLLFDHTLQTFPPYCLPSLAAIDGRKQLVLGIQAAELLEDEPWDVGLRRFKVVVAGQYEKDFQDTPSQQSFYNYVEKQTGKPDTFSPELVSAIYLAHTFQIAREKITNLPEYADQELELFFNVCLPIDHIENKKVLNVFLKILAWSELIDQEWQKKGKRFNPTKYAKDCEKHANYKPLGRYGMERQSPDARVFAVPEAVAQAACYFTSLQRESGLHAIIDIGSGTTDVSIFNLRDQFHDLVPYWYAGRNIPGGCHHIEKALAEQLKKNNKPVSSNQISERLQKLNMTTIRNKTPKNLEECRIAVLNSLRELYDRTRPIWGQAYTKRKGESYWKESKIFITGGGAYLPDVKRIFAEPWWSQLKNFTYDVSELPIPENFVPDADDIPFGRLAVAYGLAKIAPDLDDEDGGIVLPRDCPDQTPPPLPVKKLIGYSAGSGVIPRPGWV